MTRIQIRLAALALLSAAPAPALAHEGDPGGLGRVDFVTSCAPKVRAGFNTAMAYQHSFWYRAAFDAFHAVLKADPACAIAYWGIAQSLLFNPFTVPPAKNLADGWAAAQKGLAAGPKTPRERDFLEAIGAFYKDHDTLAHGVRVAAYLKAMEAMAARYPADDETQIFYALALNVAASPADKTYAHQLKAAAILERIFRKQPLHPGVSHYLIHTYDYPAIASKGLDAARRYARIAPAAPHALHMPSHIFTRVGHWNDSIASNAASAKAAKADKGLDDQLHAQDYLVYAYLQTGRDAAALRTLADMRTLEAEPTLRVGAHFALAASAARYRVERADWAGAAALPVRVTEFAFADAMTHFARALGAARSGAAQAARADIAMLGELAAKLARQSNAYWAEQVEIQRQVAEAWLALAEGKPEEALAALRAAADREDRTDKHPITPGPLAPARELLGDMLLERGAAAEALAAFEAVLTKEPNRLRAHLGAARAAAKAGDAAKARRHYGKLRDLVRQADTARPEFAEARAALGKK